MGRTAPCLELVVIQIVHWTQFTRSIYRRASIDGQLTKRMHGIAPNLLEAFPDAVGQIRVFSFRGQLGLLPGLVSVFLHESRPGQLRNRL